MTNLIGCVPEEIIRERAFELADQLLVDEDEVYTILERMAADGNDLDDLEGLESELKLLY